MQEKPLKTIDLLKKRFGDDIISGGVLDRRELARRAFATKEGTADLSAITHPEITRLAVEEIHFAQKNGKSAAVIDAALLFDSPLYSICEKNISVIADEKIRLERITERDGISEADAMLRINAQPPAEYYIQKADIIINNNGEDLENQLVNI